MSRPSISNRRTTDFSAYKSTNASENPFVYDKVFSEPAFLSIYVLIFVPSVVCNSLVCWIVKQNRSMHTKTNFLLVNLAVADMLATILSIFHVVDYLMMDLHLGGSYYFVAFVVTKAYFTLGGILRAGEIFLCFAHISSA